MSDPVASSLGPPEDCAAAPTSPARTVTNATEILLAYARTRKTLRLPTPLLEFPGTLREFNVSYKCDYVFPTGSFKERGALNALLLLTPDEKAKGVVAASAGNHALALAYHGKRLEIPVTVVLPFNAPLTTIENCHRLGACVLQHGQHLGESSEHATMLAFERGLVCINAYNNPAVVNGAGGWGIMDDVDDVVVDDDDDTPAMMPPPPTANQLRANCATLTCRSSASRRRPVRVSPMRVAAAPLSRSTQRLALPMVR